MKNNLTELVFILDRSGSMAGLESDTIGGFNAMIQKQKQEPGDCYVSTVLFDNSTKVVHDRVRLEHVRPITGRTARGLRSSMKASVSLCLRCELVPGSQRTGKRRS